MPILPLDHVEPFAATLGVMLYPGTEADDPQKARAFVSWWLAKPLSRYHQAGHRLPYEALMQIAVDGGVSLSDLDDRFRGGTATGEVLTVLWALFNTDRELASWSNAIKIAQPIAQNNRSEGSRTYQWGAKSRFRSSAHLWAAWCIREGRFGDRPDVGYDGYDDFQSFLAEAEILREWGQTWLPPRKNSWPFLPSDVWRVPETWRLPERQAGWPKTGMIPKLKVPDDTISKLKPAGRPRKVC
jgi:hypothetical protein